MSKIFEKVSTSQAHKVHGFYHFCLSVPTVRIYINLQGWLLQWTTPEVDVRLGSNKMLYQPQVGLGWAVTKYRVGVGWAVTKYWVGVGWAVTKYWVGVGWAVTKYQVGVGWTVTKYWIGFVWAVSKYWVGFVWAVTKYRVYVGWAVTKYWGLLTLQPGCGTAL